MAVEDLYGRREARRSRARSGPGWFSRVLLAEDGHQDRLWILGDDDGIEPRLEWLGDTELPVSAVAGTEAERPIPVEPAEPEIR